MRACIKLHHGIGCGCNQLFAMQLSAALERVRAGADIMPRRQLEKVLVAELGDGWREKVDDFEYDPLAAASIGQVCPSGPTTSLICFSDDF